MLITKITALDKHLNNRLISFRKPWLLKVLRSITHLGSGAFWAVVYGYALLSFQEAYGTLIVTILVAELIGLVSIIIMRYLTRRERPGSYPCPRWTPWNRYSFPSHHTARMFMLTFLLGSTYRGLFPFILLAAIIIGFTRIFLEKHYLSDVVAGAMVGLCAGALALLISGT